MKRETTCVNIQGREMKTVEKNQAETLKIKKYSLRNRRFAVPGTPPANYHDHPPPRPALRLSSALRAWCCGPGVASVHSAGQVHYLVGAFPVQFLLVLVPLHELFHEGDCHFAVLKLGPAVLVLNG